MRREEERGRERRRRRREEDERQKKKKKKELEERRGGHIGSCGEEIESTSRWTERRRVETTKYQWESKEIECAAMEFGYAEQSR